MYPIKLLRYGLAGWIYGGRRECVLCGHRVWRFMPYRNGSRGAPALSRAIDMVGSNLDAFECPRCGSHDRERHLFLYLRALGLLSAMNGRVVVHFAPEARLSTRIAQEQPARYVRCDLYPSRPDVERVDLLAMPFADESVDFVIANHVLEHVSDDVLALREIGRVLAPAGIAILQTPYSRTLRHTWQDPGIVDAVARLQAYGQEDHVRLYGQDIFARFAVGPLVADVGTHAALLPNVDADRLGVNPMEPLFLFRKRGPRP
jgi:SAM-dependent methyltransferase